MARPPSENPRNERVVSYVTKGDLAKLDDAMRARLLTSRSDIIYMAIIGFLAVEKRLRPRGRLRAGDRVAGREE